MKFTADIVCNNADLVFKNITAPTELFNQLSNPSVTLLPPIGLLLPDFILRIESSIASRHLVPYAASILFIFSSENIMSMFSLNSCWYSALLTLLIPPIISVVILPPSQSFPGAGYSLPFCILISSSVNTLNLASLFTKSFNSLISLLDKPGISIPCLVQAATRTA